jgi:hypothetical protein
MPRSAEEYCVSLMHRLHPSTAAPPNFGCQADANYQPIGYGPSGSDVAANRHLGLLGKALPSFGVRISQGGTKTFVLNIDIRRLTGKVRNEIVAEVDRAKIEPRLAELRENYRMMRERLYEIVYWKPENHPGERKPANRDVNEAAKNIVMRASLNKFN